MSEMVPSGSKYSDDIRKQAATLYAVKGVASIVSRDMNIPETTISDWRNTDWWDDIIVQVRSEKSDEHIAQYNKLIDEGQRIALEKLPEASARDAMIIAATATDKTRLLLNQPTSISSNSSSIEQLQKRFEALASRHTAIEDSIVSTIDNANDNTNDS